MIDGTGNPSGIVASLYTSVCMSDRPMVKRMKRTACMYSTAIKCMCVCVCVYVVCVIIPFILDVRLVDVSAGATQEEGYTGLLIHLPSAVVAFVFSRQVFSPPFPSSTVKSNFAY